MDLGGYKRQAARSNTGRAKRPTGAHARRRTAGPVPDVAGTELVVSNVPLHCTRDDVMNALSSQGVRGIKRCQPTPFAEDSWTVTVGSGMSSLDIAAACTMMDVGGQPVSVHVMQGIKSVLPAASAAARSAPRGSKQPGARQPRGKDTKPTKSRNNNPADPPAPEDLDAQLRAYMDKRPATKEQMNDDLDAYMAARAEASAAKETAVPGAGEVGTEPVATE